MLAQDSQRRRETAAKVLTSLVQRDPEARQSLITSGALKHILELLGTQVWKRGRRCGRGAKGLERLRVGAGGEGLGQGVLEMLGSHG